MSQSINTLVLDGHLTADPESTADDAVVFTLAHTRSRKLYGWGWTEWETETSYLRCIVLRQHLKNAVLDQARNGSSLVVRGRIETFATGSPTLHDGFQIVVDDAVFGSQTKDPAPAQDSGGLR